MKLNEAFPSKYIKAADLQGKNVPVTISHYAIEEVGDGEHKLVLYFQGKEKGLVCNKTNAERIGLLYGDDLDQWSGCKVILTTEMTSFAGKAMMGLRIRAPQEMGGYTNRGGYSVNTPKNHQQADPIEEMVGPNSEKEIPF